VLRTTFTGEGFVLRTTFTGEGVCAKNNLYW
jgi:hypothetical protein